MASAVAVAFACLFLVSLLGKLDDLGKWREASSGWLPGETTSVYLGLPLAEAGLALVLCWRPDIGLRAAAAFLVFLTAAVLLRGRDRRGTECGCFGTFVKSQIGPKLIVRNVVLAAAAALASTQAAEPSISFPAALLGGAASLLFVIVMEAKKFNRTVAASVPEEA